MITTYWRIPNIFTISQEHKGKTTGNGANFPTLHSNKPEQRSEKINVETRHGCSLDPQKVTKEALVKALRVYPRARRGQRGGGAAFRDFTAALCSKTLLQALLRKQDGDLGHILPSVGSPCWPAFSQPRHQQTLFSGWLTTLGAGQPEAGRDGRQDGVYQLTLGRAPRSIGAHQGCASPAKQTKPEPHVLCKAPGNTSPAGYAQALDWL